MKITSKHCLSASAIIVALSLSSCARFDERMQANGSFDYNEAELITPYKTGDFTNDEARNSFNLPALTEQQIAVGLKGENVDIRPPTQLMPVIDSVIVETTSDDNIKVWFNALNEHDNMQRKVMFLIESYFANKNVNIVNKDDFTIQTDTFVDETIFGSLLNKNTLVEESSYKLSIDKGQDNHRIGVTVDVLSYQETNEGTKLKLNLVGSTKQDIEMRLVNDLLQYAYQITQAEQLASADSQPLSIRLGFDDNHQSAWIADNEFLETWTKLPNLFSLLNFEMIDSDKNLGYFLVKYSEPDEEYWAENNLQPFELDDGEYFVQLGEFASGSTSVVWLDKDKKPLTDQQVSDLYISITEYVRGALEQNNKQTIEF